MTTELELRPSVGLKTLIEDLAETLTSFAEKWNQIKRLGVEEGFTEKELEAMVRSKLKPQLNKDQIYYLFNAEKRKQESNQVYHRNIATNEGNNDIEQSKNDHGNEFQINKEYHEPRETLEGTEPLYTLVKSTSDLEGTIVEKIDHAADVMTKLEDLTRDNENLRKELHDEREVIAKLSVTTADKQDTNVDRLFDMLPNDDKTTYKMKKGGITAFGRRYLDFRSRGITSLTWWIREDK